MTLQLLVMGFYNTVIIYSTGAAAYYYGLYHDCIRQSLPIEEEVPN